MSYLTKYSTAFVFFCTVVLLYGCNDGNNITGNTLNDNEFAIEELKGSHSATTPSSFNSPIELNTQYNSINNVSILIEGIASAGLATLTETGEEVVIPVQFNISMAESFELGSISLLTPIATFSELDGNFNEQIVLIPTIQPLPDWSFLEDGVATLRFSWTSYCPPTDSCTFIELPMLQISSAILIIDGNKIE